MGIGTLFQTGRSGLIASKAALATTGHNITNVNTEGYSRQRVHNTPSTPEPKGDNNTVIGTGVTVNRIERVNDAYIEKQLRQGNSQLKGYEEKELMLNQVEDIFNEMNGDGVNRLMARFFNEFRKLSNDPNSEAVRQSVRESTNALVKDFRRIRTAVVEAQRHIDSRIEGFAREANQIMEEIRDLNMKIQKAEIDKGSPNDLLDQRDQALKKLNELVSIAAHKDKHGAYIVELPGIGPIVSGPIVEKFDAARTPEDAEGKPENSMDLTSSASVSSRVTHRIKGGKMGALVEVRDKTLSTILDRLDDMAFTLAKTVNEVHRQGYARSGRTQINFFQELSGPKGAAEYLALSDDVVRDVNNIAAAAEPDSPGDNRLAIAISGIQGIRLMSDGHATLDDYYNSIISDVGIVRNHNKASLNQQTDIMTQLKKIREQVSGVSLDEETANLLQFQHSFDASAKLIKVADEMLDTIINLKR